MLQLRHLPNDARLRAIGMLEAGMRQVEVARRLGVSQSVISCLRTRLAQTNSTLDRRRSGRPRSTSQAQDRFLRKSALRSRSVSAEQLRERLSRTGTRVSVQTVRNRLYSAGFSARRPYVGVPLSQRHRQARLAWTRQRRRWTNQQWATVLFTDESRFLLDMLDRRRRVWRRRGERYANWAIVEHERYGGGSLMVWGGISVRSRTELLVLNRTLTGQHYINEVLQPVVLSFVQQHHVVLQDDNAKPHRARIVQQFLQQNNVDHLDWPARSPDLSLIEQLMGHSRPACTLYDRAFHDQERSKLWAQPWRRIPQLQKPRLIRSMRRRCVACIDATGGHTRYWQIYEVLLVTLVIFHTNLPDGFLSVREMM